MERKKHEKKTNKNEFVFFCENYPPTRHIKYKVITFAPSNKSIIANKLPSTNLKLFLRRRPMAIFKTLRKIITEEISFQT